jgi:S-DNA-T family DNA segregation ATPase FtsK/SpoIIIE
MNHYDYKRTEIPIRSSSTQVVFWHPAADTHCLLVGGGAEERAALTDTVTADFAAAGWSVQRGDSVAKQQEIITDIWVLMEQRYSQLMTDPDAREQLEPILLVVDEEYGSLTGTSTEAAAATDKVHDLLRLARSAKIHVLVCASSPTVGMLSGDMRDNLAVRVPVDDATRDHELLQV